MDELFLVLQLATAIALLTLSWTGYSQEHLTRSIILISSNSIQILMSMFLFLSHLKADLVDNVFSY